MKAIWNNAVLAESDQTILVEGNHYFPPEALRREQLQDSNTRTTCPWKGMASYYHLQVDGAVNKDAAWYYPTPQEAASHLKDYVAFWRGVRIAP